MLKKLPVAATLMFNCFWAFSMPAAADTPKPFTYQIFLPADSSALNALKVYPPQGRIDAAQLQQWDAKADELIALYKLPSGTATRLQSYLYNAQLAFAALSKNLSGSLAGSLDPISIHVLQLFFPEYNPEPAAAKSDAYSKALTNLLAEKIDARFKEEQENLRPYKEITAQPHWKGTEPYAGISIASLKTWCLESCDQYRCPKPPSMTEAFWQLQLEAVKKAMHDATPKQKEAIIWWASINKPSDGDWTWIANEYMEQHHVPLEKRLLVRSMLSSAMHDATIAVFDSKYTYWIKRPNMLDPSLKTVIETPNHPSLPSGHSTISATAAEVLTHFFPENKVEWQRKAEEAGHSRIWAGLHFPIDHEDGVRMGRQVAWHVLNSAPAY